METWQLVWPDLWLEVEVAAPPADEGARLRSAFSDAVLAWNYGHPDSMMGAVGDARLVGRDAWEISVSFGDEGPAALNTVLAAVEKAIPGIVRVVVRSFPVRL